MTRQEKYKLLIENPMKSLEAAMSETDALPSEDEIAELLVLKSQLQELAFRTAALIYARHYKGAMSKMLIAMTEGKADDEA